MEVGACHEVSTNDWYVCMVHIYVCMCNIWYLTITWYIFHILRCWNDSENKSLSRLAQWWTQHLWLRPPRRPVSSRTSSGDYSGGLRWWGCLMTDAFRCFWRIMAAWNVFQKFRWMDVLICLVWLQISLLSASVEAQPPVRSVPYGSLASSWVPASLPAA